MQVVLYTKPDCSLCVTAKERVRAACSEAGVVWHEISIYDSAELFERFRSLIPVLCVDGRVVATLRFDDVSALIRSAADE